MTSFLLIAFALIVVGRLLLRKSLNRLHNEYYRHADERGCAERYGVLRRNRRNFRYLNFNLTICTMCLPSSRIY